MATIGVKKATFFPIENDTNQGTTYKQAVKLAPLMKISLTPKTAEGTLYGDDSLVEYASEITEYDVTLDTTDLTSEQLAALLGHSLDSNGGVTVSNSDVAVYGGLAFESRRSDGSTQYVVLYKTKFSPVSEEYETKGENVNFKTPSLSGKAIARVSDGKLKYGMIGTTANAAVVKKWYETPQGAPTSGARQ